MNSLDTLNERSKTMLNGDLDSITTTSSKQRGNIDFLESCNTFSTNSGDMAIIVPKTDSKQENVSCCRKSNCSKRKATKTKCSFWKKSRDKPKRPLSAYNIFFKHTRTRIITGLPEDGSTPEETTRSAIEAIIANSTKPRMPRNNRKTHGRIGFGDLARKIASQWKALDPNQRAIYEHYASIDMKRYRSEVSMWKEKKEKDVLSNRASSTRARSPDTTSRSFNESGKRSVERSDSFASSIDSQSSSSTSNEWMALHHRAPETCSSNTASLQGNNFSFDPRLSVADSQCPAKENRERVNTPDNSIDAISNRISILKVKLTKLKLEQEIKNEIMLRTQQLYASDLSIDNNIRPPVPIGPSLERMEQLHQHRLSKGDNLPPFGSNIHMSSDKGTINTEQDTSFDPIPFDEIFNPSALDSFLN